MSERHNILVIDDDEIMLAAIEDMLSDHGYRVATRSSPIGATQIIIQEEIDLVIVDLRMPVMQGDRLVTLLRSWEKVRELPVVLISGTSRESLEEVSKDLAGVSIVTKGEMDERLAAVVNYRLSRPTTGTPARRHPKDGDRGVGGFYERLARRTREAIEIWEGVSRGDKRYRELDFLIDTVHGQAQLLGLSQMAVLMAEVHAVTHKVASGAALTSDAAEVVAQALSLALTMPKLQSEGSTVDVAPLVSSLRRANEALPQA